jgi:hypothetical protein
MNTNDRITLDTLTKKRDELRAQREIVEKELEGLETALAVITRDATARSTRSGEMNAVSHTVAAELPDSISSPDIESFPFEKLKGLSQPRAAVVVARLCGGVLRPFDLERILIAAGVMKKTRYSPNIASRLLNNNPRFERVATGLYRLIDGRKAAAVSEVNATELRTIQ